MEREIAGIVVGNDKLKADGRSMSSEATPRELWKMSSTRSEAPRGGGHRRFLEFTYTLEEGRHEYEHDYVGRHGPAPVRRRRLLLLEPPGPVGVDNGAVAGRRAGNRQMADASIARELRPRPG
jgi:hypothetical protein